MKIQTFLAFGIAFGSLAACVNNIEVQTTPVKGSAVFEQAKALVAEEMRDPESTRFKPEYTAYKTNAGDTIVCGTVNAKNAMGGYVGYKPFYVRIRNGAVAALQVPSETDTYGITLSAIRKNCADAATGTVMVGS